MKKKISYMYVLMHVVFWCTYAITWSYTAVYLKSCGYDNSVVGLVTGIGAVISVILQPVLASVSISWKQMHTRNLMMILKVCSLVFTVLMMMKLPGIYTVAVLFTGLAAIDASIPSMLSSLAMDCVNSGKYVNYGLARGCGSIAYAVFSLFLGYATEWFGTGCLLVLYVITGIVTVVMMGCFPYHMAEKKEEKKTKSDSPSVISVFFRYPFLKYFLLASVLLFMGHNMLNVFLLNIIERAGGTSSNLGIALAISACVELPVMVCFVKLSEKISVEKLLVISAFFFTIKSIFTFFAVNMGFVYIVQFMQFGAFALFTPASVYFINKAMHHQDGGLGQALLGSCSLGLGGTLGNVFGGLILDHAGLGQMIICAAVLSAAGVVFMTVSSRLYIKEKQ